MANASFATSSSVWLKSSDLFVSLKWETFTVWAVFTRPLYIFSKSDSQDVTQNLCCDGSIQALTHLESLNYNTHELMQCEGRGSTERALDRPRGLTNVTAPFVR